jgi:hypothetical protein
MIFACGLLFMSDRGLENGVTLFNGSYLTPRRNPSGESRD